MAADNKTKQHMEKKMFTSVGSRAASAYKAVSVETAVSEANPHQLVAMLFEGLLQSIRLARGALARGDLVVKGQQISKAVRIIDEALKPALNIEKGGDLALNLQGLYGYCVLRLTHANLHNDDQALVDVLRTVEPIAQGWKEMGGQHAA